MFHQLQTDGFAAIRSIDHDILDVRNGRAAVDVLRLDEERRGAHQLIAIKRDPRADPAFETLTEDLRSRLAVEMGRRKLRKQFDKSTIEIGTEQRPDRHDAGSRLLFALAHDGHRRCPP